MKHTQGIAPHAVLSLFMILVAGAIALSLVTAPPVAVEQVHGAANNTMAASSFVVEDSSVVVTPGSGGAAPSAPARSHEAIVYQAPDRVLVSRGSAQGLESLLVVGTHAYERIGSGKWEQIPSQGSPGRTAGEGEAAAVLFPLSLLAGSADVVAHDGSYLFVPPDLGAVLTGFGLPAALAQTGSTTFSATVAGENVSSIRIEAKGGGESVTIELSYRSVGTAPALRTPAPSDVVPYVPIPAPPG